MVQKSKATLISLSKYTGLLVAIMGLGGLVTAIGIDGTITEHVAHLYTMKFNSAMCFLFTGLAYSTLAISKLYRYKKTAMVLCLVVAVIAALTLIEHITGITVGIDQLFVKDSTAVNGVAPGRMAPQTAISFLCISTGLLMAENKRRSLRNMAQYLFHFATLMGFLSILGYLFNVPHFYRLSMVTAMTLPASVSVFLMSLAASLINRDLGLTGMFTGERMGNIMARRLFFQMVLMVILLAYLRIESHKLGMINVEFGIALFACSFMAASLILIRNTSKALNKIEREKNSAQDFFRLAVDAAPSGFIMSDKKGIITLVNSETEGIFGYTREEMIGKPIEMLVPTSIRAKHPDNMGTYLKTPTTRYFGGANSLTAVRKDGTEFPVEIGLNPVYVGNQTFVLSSVIDITERKKNEAMISNQMAELIIKNKELEQFTYIASHDLQEPLRTVSNFINIIEEDYGHQIDSDIRFYLNTINAATDRMSMLIRSLLDFSRLGRDKQLSVTDCNKTVKEVMADLAILIKITNTTIIAKPLPVINAYETELRQVFQNLVNNAIKFSKKDVPPQITISGREIEGGYEFAVQDNGIGIEPRYFERIFHIFQRLHKEGEFEGYGIGLANCYKIVQMHHGKIWVESEPGEGSTFKFTILTEIIR